LIARTGRGWGRRRRAANDGIEGWMLNAADTHAEAPFQVSRDRSPAQGATARLYGPAVVNYWAVIFERFEGIFGSPEGPHRDHQWPQPEPPAPHIGAHLGTQVVYAHRRRHFAMSRTAHFRAENRTPCPIEPGACFS
jgi:hypothetical protein